LDPTGGGDDGQYTTDINDNSLGLALGPPLSQGRSDPVSTVSTQPVKTTIAPASTSSGHDNATSPSTSDHAAPPPHQTPLPIDNLIAKSLKPPLAPKPKFKAKIGTVLKDTGHQTARLVIDSFTIFFLLGYMSLIVTVSRNFCGLDWMRNNPGGLKSEFDVYFKHLSAEQLKVRLFFLHVYLANIV
jgi:hypothetical protein